MTNKTSLIANVSIFFRLDGEGLVGAKSICARFNILFFVNNYEREGGFRDEGDKTCSSPG